MHGARQSGLDRTCAPVRRKHTRTRLLCVQARDGVNAATKSWRTQLQLPASPLAMLDAPASTPDHSQRPTPQYAPSDSPQAGSSRADVSNADARSGDRAGVSGGDRARASPLRSARRSQGEMLDAELGIDRRERVRDNTRIYGQGEATSVFAVSSLCLWDMQQEALPQPTVVLTPAHSMRTEVYAELLWRTCASRS